MLDASMILEQDLMEKKNWIWGLDGSGMEVDDEIVCMGEQVVVSSDETFFSTVNYRGKTR